MGVYEQARYSGTPLSRFIRDHLPHTDAVVANWTQQLTAAEGELPAPGLRDTVGWALELTLDLDLAATPPRQPELSYLPADQYAALLTAAGYRHHPISTLPAGAVTDPLLQHWKRADHPTGLDQARRTVLTTCLDLAALDQPMHHTLTRGWDVERRRSLFAWAFADPDEDAAARPQLLTALEHCWSAYLARGRDQLLQHGDTAVVAPKLAAGYAVIDLVLGRTLIEVKLAVEPTADDVTVWMRQLLGYVLLDRHDTFALDTIAVYCGWSGQLLTYPLPTLLAASGHGGPAALPRLRDDFGKLLAAELDGYTAWRQRERYRPR
jgi:hypothetical protein